MGLSSARDMIGRRDVGMHRRGACRAHGAAPGRPYKAACPLRDNGATRKALRNPQDRKSDETGVHPEGRKAQAHLLGDLYSGDILEKNGASDGARTRDLRRDRPAL